MNPSKQINENTSGERGGEPKAFNLFELTDDANHWRKVPASFFH